MTTKQTFLPLTKFQTMLVDRLVHDAGFSAEGVNKLYYRLRTDLGTGPHPGMDSKGEVARKPDGDLYTPSKADFTSKHVFEHDGREYTIPTRERTLKGKKVIARRLIYPSMLAIQDFYRKSERIQRNRGTREKNLGGKRQPIKSGLQPILPKRKMLMDIVFTDGFRMPTCISLKDGKEYSWVFIAVDYVSKAVMVVPIHLATQLSGTKATLNKNMDLDDDEQNEKAEDYDSSKRPSSEQTFRALQRFVRIINTSRRVGAPESYEKHGGDIHPRVCVHDNGSEYAGAFKSGIKKLREKYPRYYEELTTPLSRSHYNASERYVKTARRYFYALNQAYQSLLKEAGPNQTAIGRESNTVPKDWNWHADKQSPKNYDWTIDCNEVSRRVNSSRHSVIRGTPDDTILEQNGMTFELAYDRIVKAGKHRFRDAEVDLRLPGFSPSSPPIEGDYVRLKSYKSGNMSVTWTLPADSDKKQSLKSAANNWSRDIYKISDIKESQVIKAPKFRVINIDSKSKNRAPEGYLNRIEILKVDPGTILESSTVEGETITQLDKRLNDPDVLKRKQIRKDEEAASLAAQKVEAVKLSEKKKAATLAALAINPRPVRRSFRYNVGDVLEFRTSFFDGAGKDLATLRRASLKEGSLQGTIILRESATQSTPMLYEVDFKRPRSKAIRIGLPRAGRDKGGVDNSEDVRFVRMMTLSL
jgi:hypothetical protein